MQEVGEYFQCTYLISIAMQLFQHNIAASEGDTEYKQTNFFPCVSHLFTPIFISWHVQSS